MSACGEIPSQELGKHQWFIAAHVHPDVSADVTVAAMMKNFTLLLTALPWPFPKLLCLTKLSDKHYYVNFQMESGFCIVISSILVCCLVDLAGSRVSSYLCTLFGERPAG